MNSIFHRVSIRRWQPEAVAEETIREILKAGMQAPSAGNQQPWEFVVVSEKTTIKKLSECSRHASCAAGAPVVIVPLYRKTARLPEFCQIDLAIAVENMWLRTDQLGLGGVWLAIAPVAERMAAVRQVLSLPEAVEPFCLFALGFPAEEKAQQDRWDPSRIHWVR
jgi:nitroreductase